MARDRVLAETQLFGDLAIRAGYPRELEQLDLALGQAGPAFAVRDYARSAAELVASTAEPSEGIGGASGAECAEGPEGSGSRRERGRSASGGPPRDVERQ